MNFHNLSILYYGPYVLVISSSKFSLQNISACDLLTADQNPEFTGPNEEAKGFIGLRVKIGKKSCDVFLKQEMSIMRRYLSELVSLICASLKLEFTVLIKVFGKIWYLANSIMVNIRAEYGIGED